MKAIIVTFLNAEATANVLTASSTEVGLVETYAYDVVVSTRLYRIKKLDRDLTRISKCYRLHVP